MSIRLRLALFCATLCGMVLLFVGLLSYVIHIHGQYSDLDRVLITSVGHAVAEAATSVDMPHLIRGASGFEVALRLYGPDGDLRENVPGAETLPQIAPQAVLAAPSGPPYDALAQMLPPPVVSDEPADGAFGLLTTPEQRWRVYVLPIRRAGMIVGYVEGLTPLGRVDATTQTFRMMLVTVGLFGLAIAFLGARVVAGRVLRPVAHMVETAHTITQSHNLAHRIPTSRSRDELGRLAETFNTMLASVEVAYRAQQRFVSDASHELRAPLTAIQGNLELLRRHAEMPAADRDEALAEAEREANRLARLVADLLALARADAGIALQRQPVDLDAVVLDVFQTARRLARGQELELEPFEPAQVLGDEDRLTQLVLILLDNALKYTPAGGRVTLGLRRTDTAAEIQVRDTGIGIDSADLPHVFERFYRADPARSRDPGGSGLGLAIARWIARQHGGDVTLDSTPGHGTTARVRLPLSPPH